MKIYHAVTEIYRPKVETGFPGQVEESQYTFEDGVVTLIDLATGAPLRAKNGTVYSRKLNQDDAHVVIARRLIKQRWQDRNTNSDFYRPLHYPKSGIA